MASSHLVTHPYQVHLVWRHLCGGVLFRSRCLFEGTLCAPGGSEIICVRRFCDHINVLRIFQGGRRYFSRRQIIALVGGPGNMAVYRHILVIPPAAKVLPPKNEKTPTAKTLPPYGITAEKISPYFRFTASAKKVPPTLDTVKKYQLSIPPKEYRQLSIPPKRYRQHRIPPKRYHRHWISPKRYHRY